MKKALAVVLAFLAVPVMLTMGLPAALLLLLAVYLFSLVLDVRSFLSGHFSSLTSLGAGLTQRAKIHERLRSKTALVSAVPESRKPEAQQPQQEGAVTLLGLKAKTGAQFVSVVYRLNSSFEAISSGLAEERVKKIFGARFFDYFSGADLASGLSAESELDSSFTLHAAGISYTYSLPLIVPVTEDSSVRAVMTFGFLEEPEALRFRFFESVARDYMLSFGAKLQSKVSEAELAKKDEAMSHMGHDLRSPINNLRAILSLFAQDSASNEERELYESAVSNCDTLSEIVSDMLDFTRHRAGKLEAIPSQLNLDELFGGILKAYRVSAKLRKIELTCTAEPGLFLYADRRQVKRILGNLISNALKYTKAGGKITLTASRGADGGLTLSVSDTGLGMSEEQVAKIFEPFSRFHIGAASGVGLGMAIFKVLVELNGGSISVDSKEGSGTRVSVSFPKSLVSKKEAFVDSPRVLRKIQVLLVDDDEDLLKPVRKVLSSPSVEVHTAASVKEARAVILAHSPEVLITDCELEDGRGEEVLAAFKEAVPGGRSAVVTGSDDLKTKESFERAGVDLFMIKPAELSVLRDWIHGS